MTSADLPDMWMDSTGVRMEIISSHGPVYIESLAVAVLRTRAYGPEVLRFTWDWTDPEDGEVLSGAAQLLLQEIPDPRARKTEEQPAAPADATALEANCMRRADRHEGHFWTLREHQYRCDGRPAGEVTPPRFPYRGPSVVQPLFRQSGPAISVGKPFRGSLAHAMGEVTVPCLGDDCTGCSDLQCRTALADGGDV